MRTAFIAWQISRAANLPSGLIEQLFIAALFHDVGALTAEEKLSIRRNEVENVEPHCIFGEAFISHLPMFEPSAKIVRRHHKPWQEYEQTSADSLIFASQILYLADSVERLLDRNRYILLQGRDILSTISGWSSTLIHPQAVDIFKSVAAREDFWLDLVSPRLYSLLLHNGPFRNKVLPITDLMPISEMFRNLIDFRSPFTGTHSSGVAATASSIGLCLGITKTDIEFMEIAGNLHDLGKMAVPNSIINKPDKLTTDEFSIMRQHTYFTYSLLSMVGGMRQIAECAAFHHEKLDGSGYPFHIDASKISTGARIIAAADVFTAVAEDRPYRKGMARSDTISVLRGLSSKKHLDKNVVGVIESNYDAISASSVLRQKEARESYQRKFQINLN
ncbi:MAG: HD domain-containing phosphohydrolase [Syntrophobacteraceae bacterium]|jgi:HD-GYP domain-containing protein (c-di-GMP phosphodiesterase class II)